MYVCVYMTGSMNEMNLSFKYFVTDIIMIFKDACILINTSGLRMFQNNKVASLIGSFFFWKPFENNLKQHHLI